MFHLKDGLYFEQLQDGGVRIIVKESGAVDAPVLREFRTDDGGWCSVIANMSYYGEDNYGYYRAQEFHSKRLVTSSMPLADKPAKW